MVFAAQLMTGLSHNLTNRKQFVSINGHDSHEVDMLFGVPTGLSPETIIIFNLYIRDLHKAIKYHFMQAKLNF